MAGKPTVVAPPKSQAPLDVRPAGLRLVAHTLAIAAMINGFFAMDNMPVGEALGQQYGGHWAFLTIQGLALSVATTFLAAASDLLPAVPLLRAAKRGVLLVAMPVEIAISSIYWPLVLFAPRLMLPPQNFISAEPSSEHTDQLFYIPLWIDLSLHALPALTLLIDFYFLEKKYKAPITTVGAPVLAASFAASYVVWIEHCATINHTFPYPFLTVASFEGRLAIYAGATIGALLVFWGLNSVHP